MLGMAWSGRMLPRCVMKLACGALAICSIALMLVVPVGVEGDHPANGFQEKGTAKLAAPKTEGTAQPEEAPTGFNNATNGFEAQAAFDKDRESFEEVETIEDGLGPVYNATSCVSCHQNPVTGSSSQVSEIRAGHLEP